MKTIVKIIDFLKDCLDTPHKRRGMACLICSTFVFAIMFIGIFYTINNFINKPINTDLKIEKSK